MDINLKKFMSSEVDGVFYIGHASALVRISKELFLFDPIWDNKPYGDYWDFYPAQINCDEILSQVKGVIISHIHEDHVCLPILKRLPRSCKIHNMIGRQPLIDKLLKSEKMIEDYTHSEWHKISDDVEIMFIPHAFNSIDSSCFIRSNAYCVYVGSDNFLNARWNNFVKDFRPDVAMIPYAFIHWYPRLMNMDSAEKWKEVDRLNAQSLEQAKQTIKALDPKVVIPFGNNLIYAERSSILNTNISMPDDLVDNPMETGGWCLANGEYSQVQFEVPAFKSKMFDPIDCKVNIEGWMLEEVRQKISPAVKVNDVWCFRQPKPIVGHEFIVNDISIELTTFQVGVNYGQSDRNITRFDLDKEVFNEWIAGNITFEAAIGTRRFLCTRTPNVYNLEVFEFMNNYL